MLSCLGLGLDSPDEDALVELPLQGELLGRGHRALAVIHIAVLALLNTGESWTVNSRARIEPLARFSQSTRRSPIRAIIRWFLTNRWH